jgi:hypothetical protein
MRCYPVSTRINHVANDDEECSCILSPTFPISGVVSMVDATLNSNPICNGNKAKTALYGCSFEAERR